MSRVSRFPFELEDLKSDYDPKLVRLSSEVKALRGVCVLLISLLDPAIGREFVDELRRTAMDADRKVESPFTELDGPFVTNFAEHLRTIAKEAGEIIIPFNHDAHDTPEE